MDPLRELGRMLLVLGVLGRLGAMAADCTARAIARGVFAAETLHLPSWRERYGG